MAAAQEDPDLSSRLLAAIVASSTDAIISKTAAGIVTSWNRSAERVFGYTAEEMIGKPIAVLAIDGQEDEMPALLSRVCYGERVEHFETSRRRKDGSTAQISLSLSPVLDVRGDVIGVAKVARDIGSDKAAAAALAQAETLLRSRHRELLHAGGIGDLGMMVATLAHEVNQPLSAISNYLAACQQLMQRRGADDRAMNHGLQRAANEVVRASEIVRRLRSYAKPNDGLMKPELLGKILEDANGLATIDTGKHDITVSLSADSDTTMVLVDRVEIQQVLLNLIRNASEAVAGQDRRELRISSLTKADLVEIRVSDTGVGIDGAIRDRLFQPFVTTKADSIGIGLSICSKIIEAHGGELWTEHVPGGSTAFVFTVQLAPSCDTLPLDESEHPSRRRRCSDR